MKSQFPAVTALFLVLFAASVEGTQEVTIEGAVTGLSPVDFHSLADFAASIEEAQKTATGVAAVGLSLPDLHGLAALERISKTGHAGMKYRVDSGDGSGGFVIVLSGRVPTGVEELAAAWDSGVLDVRSHAAIGGREWLQMDEKKIPTSGVVDRISTWIQVHGAVRSCTGGLAWQTAKEFGSNPGSCVDGKVPDAVRMERMVREALDGRSADKLPNAVLPMYESGNFGAPTYESWHLAHDPENLEKMLELLEQGGDGEQGIIHVEPLGPEIKDLQEKTEPTSLWCSLKRCFPQYAHGTAYEATIRMGVVVAGLRG